MTGLSLVLGFLVLALVAIGAFSIILGNRSPFSFRLKPLLTDNEVEFYGRLKEAMHDEAEVFPQVAMSAFLRPSIDLTGKDGFRARSAYSQKVVDFVICEKGTLRPVIVVELDDRTHNAEKDAARDKMLTSSGLCVVRYRSNARPSPHEIRAQITPLLREHGGTRSPLNSFLGNLRSTQIRRRLSKS